jgi:heme exporter protein A
LTKRIGNKTILQGVDLELPTGQFLTIFGPNGAGKTTLLNMLSLLSKPTSGRLTINGRSVDEETEELRKEIGVISHHTYLYDNLTAGENLRFYGRMYGVPDLDKRIPQVIEEVGLTLSFNDPVRTFSRGMQQRLSIARAILHSPSLLLLDEPYTGLDQQAISMLNSVLVTLKNGQRTIVMITHSFDEGLFLSDQVVVLSKGQIVFRAASAEIDREEFPRQYLELVGGTACRS